MAEPYATIADVETLFRPLTTAETEKATALLPMVSDVLRIKAKQCNRDLDDMITATPELASVATAVTVSVVSRILLQNTTDVPLTQESQSGLGYSWSGTYANPAGGIATAILNADLKALGLKRPRIGVIDFFDPRNGDPRNGEVC